MLDIFSIFCQKNFQIFGKYFFGLYDTNNTNLIILDNKHVEEAAKRIAREKELAKVSIKKEDVDLIAHEMEISKTKAERTLREHAGSVVEALAALTN